MRNLKVFLASIIALCMFLVSCGVGTGNGTTSESESKESVSQESESKESESLKESVDEQEGVLAHWKFQNVEGYYSGNVDDENLVFFDLSGHGNDLITVSEGNGSQLDIFEWDEEGAFGGAPALRFNNTLEKAQSVDPYDPSQTSYSGAYVSGKYFETVENAALNGNTGREGWTIEIIFKVSREWNNTYNRYVGIFSKQGVSKETDEPVFAMMLTSASDNATSLGDDGAVGVQYVHINRDEYQYKNEYKNGEIFAEEWVHFMAASDGRITYLYLNGEQIDKIVSDNVLSSSSMGSWEVGVGRKYGEEGAKTMNTRYEEGLIRRLFCGTISEIRLSKGQLSISDSLIAS